MICECLILENVGVVALFYLPEQHKIISRVFCTSEEIINLKLVHLGSLAMEDCSLNLHVEMRHPSQMNTSLSFSRESCKGNNINHKEKL